MLEAAGDTEGAKEVRRKMAEQNKALKSYCDSNGLKYRSDRVRTYGSVNNGGKLRESGSKKQPLPMKRSLKFQRLLQKHILMISVRKYTKNIKSC